MTCQDDNKTLSGLQAAISAMDTPRGGRAALAKALGISPVAITKWKQIPIKRLLDVERVTGVPRERLRPDLYRTTWAAE